MLTDTKIVQLDDDDAVENFIENGGRILYFTADWCQPCKFYAPRVEKAANDENVRVGKINSDFAYKSLHKYSIRSVPTLVRVDHKGDMQSLETGARDVEFVKSFIG